MKKAVCLCLVIVTVFMFIACGKTDEAEDITSQTDVSYPTTTP